MYSPPPAQSGVQTLDAADNTVTVAGTPKARTVAVGKHLDSSYLTDFAAAVAAQLAQQTAKQETAYATAAALPANTYNNAAGTLTANANGALAVDGQNVAVGQRVLVKNEATATHNGIYVVTATGGAGAPYILTRAADYDSAAEIGPGDLVPVAGPAGALGATNDQTVWVSTAPVPFVLGASTVTFLRIGSGAVALTSDAQTLGADNSNSGALTTFLTTATLAVGTWLVVCGAELTTGSSSQGAAVQMAAGTATATFAGNQSGGGFTNSFNGNSIHVTLACVVTVTVAGTLVFQSRCTAGPVTVRQLATVSGNLPGATGYAAVKIA